MTDKSVPPTTIDFSNLPVTGIVHHRLFLLIGRCGDRKDDFPTILARSKPHGPDGKIRVSHSMSDAGDVDVETKATNSGTKSTDAQFPDAEWEVNATYFKALIPLKIGENVIKLTYFNLSDPPTKRDDQRTIKLTYEPVVDVPKLHLAIVCAKDSPAVAAEAVKAASRAADEVAARAVPATTKPATAVDSKELDCATLPESRAHTAAAYGSPQGNGAPVTATKEKGFHRFVHKAGQKLRALQLNQGSVHSDDTVEGQQQVPLIDTPPGAIRRMVQEQGLELVRRRLALQAYLWQVS